MRIGGTAEMAWMQICDPSDKEKGHYSMEISDGVKTHTRTFDLSGQGKNLHLCHHLFSLQFFSFAVIVLFICLFILEFLRCEPFCLWKIDSIVIICFVAYTDAYEEYLRLK